MINYKTMAAMSVILLSSVTVNAYSETTQNNNQETVQSSSDGRTYTGQPSITPETFKDKLDKMNIQKPKVINSDSLGSIPILPDEVPTNDEVNMWNLRRDSMHYFTSGLNFNIRNGEEGLDQLNTTEIPLNTNFNTGMGRIIVNTSAVFLTSGILSNSEFTNRFYGTLANVAPASRPSDISDDQSGEAISIGYEVSGFEIYVGSTPLGFEISNATARLGYKHTFNSGFNFGLSFYREAVKDSILSYAGLVDPVSGEKWGGVIKNAGKISFGYDSGDFGVYADWTTALYEGENVLDNDFYQINLGLYFYPYRGENMQFSSGFNLTTFGFDNNLRYFTYGQGGYFSPESFLSASIPFRIAYTEGKLTVKVDLGISAQNFSEDPTVFFPSDSSLQTTLEATELVQPVTFDGSSQTEFSTRGGAEIIYQITPKLSATGRIGFSNAADYEETFFVVNTEYRFGRGY